MPHPKRFRIVLPVILLVTFGVRADDTVSNLYERLAQACVEILADGHLEGSGWMADAEGHVFTASHVVGAPGRRIEVFSPTLGRVKAEVVAVDGGNDAALLKLPARAEKYPFLPLAKHIPPATAPIFIFGAPSYRHGVLLSGRVARANPVFEFQNPPNDYIRVFYTTIAGPPGMSGGPWVNAKGEVAGLNTGVLTNKGAQQGIGFVIPCDALQALLRAKRNARTPSAGMAFEELWEQPADFLRRYPKETEGLVAKAIKKDGPAAGAGIKDGDVVVAVDSKPFRLREDGIALLRAKQPGDTLVLTMLAPNGERQEKTLTMGHLEAAWEKK